MKRAPFTHDDVLANHDAKLKAIGDCSLQTARQYAETSGDYALHIELGLNRITRLEFNDQRNARLHARAERLRRDGHEPHRIAGILARKNVFNLSARTIRRILKSSD